MDKKEIGEALAGLNSVTAAARPFVKLAEVIPALEKVVQIVAQAEAAVADAESRKAKLESEGEALIENHEALQKDHDALAKSYALKAKEHETGLKDIVARLGAEHRAELLRMENDFQQLKGKMKTQAEEWTLKATDDLAEQQRQAEYKKGRLAAEVTTLEEKKSALEADLALLTGQFEALGKAFRRGS
jgi:hypothetical protein